MKENLRVRKVIIIASVALLLLMQHPASAQRKTRKKPAPSTPQVEASDIPPMKPAAVAEDEVLFKDVDYVKLPGWRLAVEGALTSDGAQTFAYYDAHRITRPNSGVARVWLKYVTHVKGKETSYTLVFEEFDCPAQRSKTLQSTRYGSEGRPLISGDEMPWIYFTPDSIGDGIAGIVCRREWDLTEENMREAAALFGAGRRYEKGQSFESALFFYEKALEHAPGNTKVLDGISRLRNRVLIKDPPPPPRPKGQE